jgi:tetratricopeptide (TPR) repeat protein
MKCLAKDQIELCMNLLKEAESILKGCARQSVPRGPVLKLYALTLNNLGCIYKKKGKMHCALRYLQEALAIETHKDVGSHEELAGTYLNLGVTLNELGRYPEALRKTLHAILFIK